MTRCTVRWNPGHWPYVTRCSLDHGHDGKHIDQHGMTLPSVPGQEDEE